VRFVVWWDIGAEARGAFLDVFAECIVGLYFCRGKGWDGGVQGVGYVELV
jgi:hypothetical protein